MYVPLKCLIFPKPVARCSELAQLTYAPVTKREVASNTLNTWYDLTLPFNMFTQNSSTFMFKRNFRCDAQQCK